MEVKKIGRKLKTVKDLPKNWKKETLAIYEVGGSDTEVKANSLGRISNDLFDRLIRDEPEFSEAVKTGRTLSHAWWLKQGRQNLQNKEFSPTLWFMNMKNRHNWNNNTETSVKVEIPSPIINITK